MPMCCLRRPGAFACSQDTSPSFERSHVQAGTGSVQVRRRLDDTDERRCDASREAQGSQSAPGSILLDDTPDHLLCDAIAPDRTRLVHAPEDPAVLHLRRRCPTINGDLDPIRNLTADVPTFAT